MAKKVNEKVATRICYGNKIDILKCCGEKKETEFFVNWSNFSDGKTLYCKDCIEKIFKYFLDNGCNEKTALYYTLQKIDMPFIIQVYENAINKTNNKGEKLPLTMSNYISELHKNLSKKDIYLDFATSDLKNLDEVDSKVKTVEQKKEEILSLEKKWGKQDIYEDYDFLEYTFDRYTNNIELNITQEDLYRDLCRDRLLLRKINDNRYSGEETIDKVQNRISKTMGILNIDKFKVVKEKSDIERILERQIWEIENTEPAEVVDKNEYKDFLNIESDWGKHILRAMKNILSGSKDYPNISREDG